MVNKSEELIKDLIEKTKANIYQAKIFLTYSIEDLNWRAKKNSWSTLESLEHLNYYGDFHIL